MTNDSGFTSSPVVQGEGLRFSAVELFAGALAGFTEHFVMFPFDTVKTRMQSGTSTSVADTFQTVWRHERLTQLYRGCIPVLGSAIPAHGAYFGAYEAGKRVLGDGHTGIAVSACFATAAHDAVSTPFDVIKQRMQMDRNRTFRNSYQCGKWILCREGVHALYVSLPTTIGMNIPHFATYWLVYESFMARQCRGSSRNLNEEMTADFLVAGFLAGGAASIVSFPFDMVKTHLQLGRGVNFGSVIRNLVALRGVKGVFAGVVPRVMYTAPSGAIMMVTYESAKGYLESI